MKWYDYMKYNKEINYNFLKEKENCRLKAGIINVGEEILIYKHTTGQNMYCKLELCVSVSLLCVEQDGRRVLFLTEQEINNMVI